MKLNKITFLINWSIIIFSSVALISCMKDDDVSSEKNYSKVSEISIESGKVLFTLLGNPALGAKVKYNVDVYVYNYNMTYKGAKIKASGLVCAPRAEGKEFPVLSFQHGTIVAHSEAPSIDINGLLNKGVEAIAGMGYLVVLPDEIGFGASSDYFHPYLIKESISGSIVEMLSSLKEYPDGEFSGITINDSLFLMGYSHGGWATMATLESMEQSHQNNWNVIALASGAGPYFPELVKEYSFSTPTYAHPYYMGYVFKSLYDNGFISNNLTDFYTETYASKINELYDGSKSGIQINTELSYVNSDLYSTEFLTNYPNGKYTDLQNALLENSVHAWKTNTPIMLIHGANDNSIPQIVSDSLYSEFSIKGAANIDYRVIPFADHVSGAVPSLIEALIWFESFRE